LVAGLKEGSGASDRWIRERLRALVKDGSLIQYVAPSDSKCGALTYALPDRELVETEP
jgi:DNA-binding Lrp family transcriptional regulator